MDSTDTVGAVAIIAVAIFFTSIVVGITVYNLLDRIAIMCVG
jgi:hypothetical protein